jgi:hypothetical protein
MARCWGGIVSEDPNGKSNTQTGYTTQVCFGQNISRDAKSREIFGVGGHPKTCGLAEHAFVARNGVTRDSMLCRVQPRALPSLSSRALASYAPLPGRDCSSITPPYPVLLEKLALVRKHLDRPLALAEKILYSHLHDPNALAGLGKVRGSAYLQLKPQRVAMQDASAQ